MKTGREDYDHLIKNRGIAAGEPTFTVRAQDAAAADTVRAWAVLAKAAGTPAAVVEQALQQADAMAAWSGPKKPADADHLTPDQQQQLEYQHGRRAWKARPEAAPNPEIMLAERRGHDLALNTLRAELRREAEGLARKLALVRRALSSLRAASPRPDSVFATDHHPWDWADEALTLTEPTDG